jgi:hypothetical protein
MKVNAEILHQIRAFHNSSSSLIIGRRNIRMYRARAVGNGDIYTVKLRSGIKSNRDFVGFEVPTAGTVMTAVFWDAMPCSPLKVH